MSQVPLYRGTWQPRSSDSPSPSDHHRARGIGLLDRGALLKRQGLLPRTTIGPEAYAYKGTLAKNTPGQG